MKGVILAGGRATRLHPLTTVTNKHLLPLYNEPVIYHPIRKLVAAGIEKIMIVSSPRQIEHFVNLLGSGEGFHPRGKPDKQIQIVYAIQNEPRGIAQGLWLAKDYVGSDNVVLCLGDNIIEDDITNAVEGFTDGATVFLKEVADPMRFGIAVLDEAGHVVEILEKPSHDAGTLAVVGAYVYDNTVFEKLVGQPLSERGEYEITYINNLYAKEKRLRAVHLKEPWFDVGTFDSLLEASHYMREKHRKNNA